MRPSDFSPIGRNVIVRCRDAGCHVGVLLHEEGRRVVLDAGARRIWRWTGAATLSELAGSGTSNPRGCKWPAGSQDPVVLLDACEIIIVSPQAAATHNQVPVWTSH